MKDYLKLLLVMIVSLIAGSYLHKCQSPPGNIPAGVDYVTDTITVYDTIPYIKPAPIHSRQTGYKEVSILSPFHSESAKRLPPTECIDRGGDDQSDIRSDTTELTSTDVIADTPDSLTLRLPLTQNVYVGEDYKAYVSGIYPSLDSVFVYPRRETVTIKKPPKRWHIGPTIGYGYTPNGFQPYIGVSLTYSIISW